MRYRAQDALMGEIFDSIYADAYDKLYQNKDYTAECNVIERIFQAYGNEAVHSVLDLGCRTGKHAIPLAQRGYEAVAMDHSISVLTHAWSKMAGFSSNSSIAFHQGDIRSIGLGRISMLR